MSTIQPVAGHLIPRRIAHMCGAEIKMPQSLTDHGTGADQIFVLQVREPRSFRNIRSSGQFASQPFAALPHPYGSDFAHQTLRQVRGSPWSLNIKSVLVVRHTIERLLICVGSTNARNACIRSEVNSLLRQRCYSRRRRRLGHREALVPFCSYVGANLPINANASDVGHENARFTGNVGSHVP